MPRDYSVLHGLHGVIPDSAISAFQLLLSNIYDLNDQVQAIPKTPHKISIADIEAQIQSRKKINVSQFLGILAQPQNASIPEVSALPSVNDPLSQDGGAVRFNGVLYIFDGDPEPGTWIAVTAAGIIRDLAANMASYSAASYPNILFYQSDRKVFYLSDGTNWLWAFGTFRDVLVNIPTLGANDAGFLFAVTDYYHILRWSGVAWTWGDGELGSGWYALFETTPGQPAGWQICDGSTVNRLNGDGTTTAVTVPNLATPAYLKGGTASAAVAAASGTVANESTHTHPVTSPTAGPSSTVAVQAGTGTTVADDVHTHAVTTPTGAGSPHSHTSGTLELRNKQATLYYRR